MKIKQIISGLLLSIASASVFAVPVVLDITFDLYPQETAFGIWADGVYNGEACADLFDQGAFGCAPGTEANIFDGIAYDIDLSSDIGFGDGYVTTGDFASTVSGTHQFVWELDAGVYEFVIFDDFGDGICCGFFGDGAFALSVDGTEVFSGGQFDDIDSTTFTIAATAVPEPSTLVLLGLGLIGFAAARRRS